MNFNPYDNPDERKKIIEKAKQAIKNKREEEEKERLLAEEEAQRKADQERALRQSDLDIEKKVKEAELQARKSQIHKRKIKLRYFYGLIVTFEIFVFLIVYGGIVNASENQRKSEQEQFNSKLKTIENNQKEKKCQEKIKKLEEENRRLKKKLKDTNNRRYNRY